MFIWWSGSCSPEANICWRRSRDGFTAPPRVYAVKQLKWRRWWRSHNIIGHLCLLNEDGCRAAEEEEETHRSPAGFCPQIRFYLHGFQTHMFVELMTWSSVGQKPDLSSTFSPRCGRFGLLWIFSGLKTIKKQVLISVDSLLVCFGGEKIWSWWFDPQTHSCFWTLSNDEGRGIRSNIRSGSSVFRESVSEHEDDQIFLVKVGPVSW